MISSLAPVRAPDGNVGLKNAKIHVLGRQGCPDGRKICREIDRILKDGGRPRGAKTQVGLRRAGALDLKHGSFISRDQYEPDQGRKLIHIGRLRSGRPRA